MPGKTKAVILAGGRGERMGDITQRAQKCLLEIDGEPVLLHVMKSLTSAFGLVDATVCTSYQADDVERFVRKNKPKGMDVSFARDEGTTNDIAILSNLKSFLRREFVWLAGNVIALPEVYVNSLESLHIGNSIASVSCSPELNEAITHSVAKIANGKIIEYLNPPPSILSTNHLRDMTIWGLNEKIFDLISQNKKGTYIYNLLDNAIRNGQEVVGNMYYKHWIHIGYPEDLEKTMRHG